MQNTLASILAAVLSLALPTLSAPSARASTQVDMTTGTFEFTLTDLTPFDGLSPGFTIDSLNSLTRLIAVTSSNDWMERSEPGLFTPMSYASQLGTATFVTEVTSTGMHLGYTQAGPMSTGIGMNAGVVATITLLPHTRLDVALPYGWVGDTTPLPETQGIFVWANIFTPQAMDDQQATMFDGHYERSGFLRGHLFNDTDQAQSTGFEARILLDVAPAIPEPSSVGLLVAGLGVMVLMRRRCAEGRRNAG